MESAIIYHHLADREVKVYYDPKKKYVCDCGALLDIRSKNRHYNSKQHIINKEMAEFRETLKIHNSKSD